MDARQPIVDRIQVLRNSTEFLMVGIDGRGGAGKSTLADYLSSQFSRTAVVHMDDVYRSSLQRKHLPSGIGSNYDRPRLVEHVLTPLRDSHTARYQRYDWDHDDLADWIVITEVDIAIVEGVSSIADDVVDYYDLTIWVETSAKTCLDRGLARDGESARQQWEEIWLPGDEIYISTQLPHKRADIVISGEG